MIVDEEESWKGDLVVVHMRSSVISKSREGDPIVNTGAVAGEGIGGGAVNEYTTGSLVSSSSSPPGAGSAKDKTRTLASGSLESYVTPTCTH